MRGGFDPPGLLPRWTPGRGAGGVWKRNPEDFRVEEIPLGPPTGTGEHLWLRVEKIGWGTLDVVDALGAAAHVAPPAIGYAGLKDREAITVQEFTIATRAELAPLPDGMRILARSRTQKRLRVGQLAGNRFTVRIRGGNPGRARERIAALGETGMPNYYGQQRVGGHAPADGYAALSRGDSPLGFVQLKFALSAYQALLFNKVLAERGRHRLRGDLLEDGIPTGPMYGPTMPWPDEEAGELEARVLDQEALPAGAWRRYGKLTLGTRRKLWVSVAPELTGTEDGFVLRFDLPPGCYATVLLEEVL